MGWVLFLPGRTRPRIRLRGVMEYRSVGVLRLVRIAPRMHGVGDAESRKRENSRKKAQKAQKQNRDDLKQERTDDLIFPYFLCFLCLFCGYSPLILAPSPSRPKLREAMSGRLCSCSVDWCHKSGARLCCSAPTRLRFRGHGGLQASLFTDFFQEKTRQDGQGFLPEGGDV